MRQLRRNPAFTVVAIITLALGIGANTAIFSVLEGVVLAPLPYREPDRLVLVLLYNRALKYATDLSYPDFLDWRRNARSFQQIAAFTQQGFDLTNPGTPEYLDGMQVSSGFFSTLGVKLALGREFSREEDQHGGAPGVIISNRLWRKRFASSQAALGKPVTLDGVDYTTVGVLPSGFRFGSRRADVYTALGQRDPVTFNDRTIHDIACVARLRHEVSQGHAQAEMNTIQENIDQLYPDAERGLRTEMLPLKQVLVGDVGGTLLLLFGAVGLVLLIACANVANLLLARSAARAREFAIRAALGANRTLIVRQLITESVLLSLAGGALGLAVAKWGLHAVLATIGGSLPRSENIGVNTSVLLFAFAISIAVGILFGLAPALKSSNPDLEAALKERSRGSTSAHHRVQSSLVIVQMALTLVLLVGAGLLFRTIRHLWEVNPGFNAQHVVTFKVGLSPSLSKTGSSVRIAYQQLVERIRQIPGIESAGLTALVPMSDSSNEGPFWVGARQPASMAEIPRAIWYPTGPDYLRTMEIPLLRGRFLTREDNVHSELVVLIDSLLARTYFPDRNAVGQSITIPHWATARPVAARIVGVVGHVKQYGLDASLGEKPQIYYSFYQLPNEAIPSFRGDVTLAVRTALDWATVMPAIKNAVYGVGSGQPLYDARTMQELVSESISSQRLPMILLTVFAALALLLASVGIYGVVSYSVTQRVHEIGIRMALGAEKRNVLRMVIGQGLRLALSGLAIGTVASLILTRLLSSFSHLLYKVGTSDPLTLIAVSLVLTAVAVLACYIPARRATEVDPMVALRHE